MATTKDMTVGKPAALMLRFAVPLLLSSVMWIVHSTVDGIILGRFIGISAFAAVGASSFIYWVVSCLPTGMVNAFGAIFAQRFGAKDTRGLNIAVATSIWIIMILGGTLGAGGFAATDTVLRLLDTPPEILAETQIYLKIMFLCLPIRFMGTTGSSIFFAVGNSRIPFVSSIICIISNIILSLIVVLFTPFGIAGVAVATLLADLFAKLFCVFMLYKNKILFSNQSGMNLRSSFPSAYPWALGICPPRL
jgi:Na+-driven multidrug efflux pump